MPPEEKQQQKIPITEQILSPQRLGSIFAQLKSDIQKWINVFKKVYAPQPPQPTILPSLEEKKLEKLKLSGTASLKSMAIFSFPTSISTPAIGRTKEDREKISSIEQIRLPTEQPEEIQKKREEIQKNLIFSFVGGNQNSLGANHTYQTLKMWEEFGGEITPPLFYTYLSDMFDSGLNFYSQLKAKGLLPNNISVETASYYKLGDWITRIYSPTVIDAFGIKLPDLSNFNLLLESAKRQYETNPTKDNYKNYVALYHTKTMLENVYDAYKVLKRPIPLWLESAVGKKSLTKSREEEVIDFMEDLLRSYEAQQEQIQQYFEQPH